uniref:Uncharacterized protein n=2 Tax=Anopheles christyi TaxID=43041 RepID=A0A182KIS4_9DIPT
MSRISGEKIEPESYTCWILDVVEQLLQALVVLQMTADGLAHHGVLAHQHDGRSAERHTDGLHLTGANIVSADDETSRVFVEQLHDF